jgi:hypothetical protein
MKGLLHVKRCCQIRIVIAKEILICVVMKKKHLFSQMLIIMLKCIILELCDPIETNRTHTIIPYYIYISNKKVCEHIDILLSL